MATYTDTLSIDGIDDLESLRAAMLVDAAGTCDHHGQWSSSLPTFGGAEPADTSAIWSWDITRLLVGTHANDLEIVSREYWDNG